MSSPIQPRAQDRPGRPALALVRIVYGGVLLLAPTAAPAAAATGAGDRVVRGVARVLGVRHVVQGAAELLAPRRLTPRRSALVDGAHAASMLGWAVIDRRHRGPALLSAASAGLFVVVEAALPTRTTAP